MIPRKLSYAVGAVITAVVLATVSGLVIAAQNVPAPIQAPRAPTVIEEPAPSAAPPSAIEVSPAAANEAPAPSEALEDAPVSILAPGNTPAAAPPRRAGTPLIDLASPDAVIDLGPALVVSRVNDPVQPGDAWFTLGVENRSAQPISRVLIAADTPGGGVAISPYNRRPTLREVAASESAVIVEQAFAYGGNAFRVTLPPAHATTLALHFEGMAERPSLLAWTESALVAHNRRVALLFGTVSGLFLAALAFAAGTAVLTRRPFAKWASLFVAALFFAALTSAGTFDNSWLTATGGPYALFSLALALSVAAGVRLLDHVAPYEAFRPWARLWADRIAIIIVVLGFASFFGVPSIGLLIRIIAVLGAAAAAGYLAHCGRLGVAAARRLAPAATIFALVTAVAALRALGPRARPTSW